MYLQVFLTINQAGIEASLLNHQIINFFKEDPRVLVRESHEKKYKNLSQIQKKEVKRNLDKKKHNLEKIISRKKFQDFKELIFPFIFYEDIKKILQPKGWEATEIKQYLDYMMVLKEISDIKKYERGRVFTKDQIRRIKINNNNKKGKIFHQKIGL